MFSLIFTADNLVPYLWYLETTFVAVIGLCLGSFASALIYRVPIGMPWAFVRSRSACPECGHLLGVRDLVPVFSWVFQSGKCRHCSKKISGLYPAIELVSAFLALYVFIFFAGSIVEKYIIIAALPFLMALMLIDIRHKILPDQLVAIMAGLGVVYSVNGFLSAESYEKQAFLFSHIGGFFVYGLFSWFLGALMCKILKKEALGMGDIKFFAVAGLWLGIPNLGGFCILSGTLGVVLGLCWRHLTKDEVFPFGPALILAFFIILLLGGSFWF